MDDILTVQKQRIYKAAIVALLLTSACGLGIWAAVSVTVCQDQTWLSILVDRDTGSCTFCIGVVGAASVLLLLSLVSLFGAIGSKRHCCEALADGVAFVEYVETWAGVWINAGRSGPWIILSVEQGQLLAVRASEVHPEATQPPRELGARITIVGTRLHRLHLHTKFEGSATFPLPPELNIETVIYNSADRRRLWQQLLDRRTFPGDISDVRHALRRVAGLASKASSPEALNMDVDEIGT